jgi:hypothetical protein
VRFPAVLSRRALLGIAVATVAAGCRRGPSARPATTPTGSRSPEAATADAAALSSAEDIELALLAGYDRRIAAARGKRRARLEVSRAIHATHLDALRARPGAPTQSPSPGTSGSGRGASIATTLSASIPTLRRLSLAAQDGTTAAVLASISASHQTAIG